jgi:hypothetical protein
VIVAMETRVSCPFCGHLIRYFTVATVRVNRRSLRTTGSGAMMIGALEDWKCPGCREPVPHDRPLDREPYRLSDEDAAKVAEYRKRKWGIEVSGEAVEKVAG